MAKGRFNRNVKGHGSGRSSNFCIHLEGLSTCIPKICMNDYECWHCAFEQWIGEMEERQVSLGSPRMDSVAFAEVAPRVRLAKGFDMGVQIHIV